MRDKIRLIWETTETQNDRIVAEFDRENYWRSRGEQAIREEMDRRIKSRLEHGNGKAQRKECSRQSAQQKQTA